MYADALTLRTLVILHFNRQVKGGYMSENKSEVARLRQQIELECESAKFALTGVSMTAQHAFITKRYENIASYQAELGQQIGTEEAKRIVYETYVKFIG